MEPRIDRSDATTSRPYDVAVVGGAGHVGAPLSVVLAEHGLRTLIYDLNRDAMHQLAHGAFPFVEDGGEDALAKVLPTGRLGFTAEAADLREIPYLVVTIGTPVDVFHNPVVHALTDCLDGLLPYLSDSQTIILRSTVFPGATEFLDDYLKARGKRCLVAYCPERVTQGQAIVEIQSLVQMVSGTSAEAEESAARLFAAITDKIVRMQPKEAEFAKLFCNAYRYIQFAVANEFFMMADAAGLNYARIREQLMADYPRMRDLPGAGLTAGPCLYKDSMQLVAFAQNKLALAVSAVQVNEGMPGYIVSRLKSMYPLASMTVGILGVAFKANSDDTRSSLSYKLKRMLTLHARQVLTTDPFVTTDRELRPLDEVIRRSDVLVLCTPHAEYANLDVRGKPVFDIWDFLKTPAAVPREVPA